MSRIGEVIRGGARGVTIGRNVWGFEQIAAALEAFRAMDHDGKIAAEAHPGAGLGRAFHPKGEA